MTDGTPEIGEMEEMGGFAALGDHEAASWAPVETTGHRQPGPVGDPAAPGETDAPVSAADTPRPRRRSTRSSRSESASSELKTLRRRGRIDVSGGTALVLLVLACHREDTTGIDLASGTLVRARVPWPDGHAPDLDAFDVVEARLAEEPERDDLAQPEAVTTEGLPRHVGTLHGRRVRKLLHRLATPVEPHVLGFPGASAPYWEFRGFRPSLALVVPTKGPVLFRRDGDRSVWVRLGWGGCENWLPLDAGRAVRALDVARRDRIQGKDLTTALGYKPYYLVVTLSSPRDGHCYKTVRALLPRS
ncbi:MAG: hypothetical protein ACYCX8_07060 [Acidimicrobiales bacterium]